MRSLMTAVALATMLGACAGPTPAAPTGSDSAVGANIAHVQRDVLLGLADLPHGWMVTRETIDNASEMAVDTQEADSLVSRGFVAHHQREFQNRYGGGPRELIVSVSWYDRVAGASTGVAENAAQVLARAESFEDPVRIFEFDLAGADELRAFEIDRGTQERVYLAFFRVGGASAAVMVNGYRWNTGPELLLAVTKDQVRRIRP
jgi:hypothetical protein